MRVFYKIKLRIKQYGLKTFVRRYVISKPIEPFYKNYKNLVLAIPEHVSQPIDSRVQLLSQKKLKDWKISGIVNNIDYNRYGFFLQTHCIGYYIEIENDLAAIGFVQTKGTYKYGKYSYELPEKIHMLKNLYVKPEYRGKSLGKLINVARINSIPDSFIPCVFVLPENRYAVRNLKMFGFENCVQILHTTWLNKYHKRRIKVLGDKDLAQLIISGFKDA